MRAEDKGAIRARVRRAVRAMSDDARAEASECLNQNLLSSDLLRRAPVVLLFSPLPDEPQIQRVAATLARRGVLIAAPRIDWATHEMDAWLVRSLDVGTPGGMIAEGGPVPQPTRAIGRVGSHRIAAVVVPGVAFDLSGRRLGRGRGYYDRFLPRCDRAARIGVGFDGQIVPEIPMEDHDAPLDAIVTDQRVILAERRRG